MLNFVEYTGWYPNLCSGILVLNVDGREYVFGDKRENGELVGFNFDTDFVNRHLREGLYERFWTSGGSVWFDEDWNEHVEDGEWNIYQESLPEELWPYTNEIREVFNDNVPYGCCGGCV